MRVEGVPGYECKNIAVFRRPLLPVLSGNVSEAEEDSCSHDPDGGTDITQTVYHLLSLVQNRK